MLENVEGAMREAIEEVIGETRQKPTSTITPAAIKFAKLSHKFA
jgi:hypothetical protein